MDDKGQKRNDKKGRREGEDGLELMMERRGRGQRKVG